MTCVVDAHEEFMGLPTPAAQPLFIAVERETFDVRVIAFKSVAPGIEIAERLSAFELAAAPEKR